MMYFRRRRVIKSTSGKNDSTKNDSTMTTATLSTDRGQKQGQPLTGWNA
jgi:hypothetical protein